MSGLRADFGMGGGYLAHGNVDSGQFIIKGTLLKQIAGEKEVDKGGTPRLWLGGDAMAINPSPGFIGALGPRLQGDVAFGILPREEQCATGIFISPAVTASAQGIGFNARAGVHFTLMSRDDVHPSDAVRWGLEVAVGFQKLSTGAPTDRLVTAMLTGGF